MCKIGQARFLFPVKRSEFWDEWGTGINVLLLYLIWPVGGAPVCWLIAPGAVGPLTFFCSAFPGDWKIWP